ncbi:MAG: endopeptidase La [Deltaproteobacteria bacterium]|nr:endopeptidase La [Deltaproteobacteria bacterium]
MAFQDIDFETEKIVGEPFKDLTIPPVLSLIPVRDVVVYTDMILPLLVGRENSIMAVEKAVTQDRLILLTAQKDSLIEDPKPEDLYSVGTAAIILRTLKLTDGTVKILVQGLARVRILEFLETQPFFRVRIQPLSEQVTPGNQVETEALMRNVREQSQKILSLKDMLSADVIAILNSIEEPGQLADLVASNLRLKVEASQEILELSDPLARLQRINEHLAKELEVSKVQARIQSEAKEEMGKGQREYYLREQLRAIRRELGEYEEKTAELKEYRTRLDGMKMPKEAKEEALKQVSRLEQMHPDSAETSIIRTYVDWIVSLPWDKKTRDKIRVKEAQKILDEDHYDLKKVKERILEFLSVRKLNPKMKGPILCFVGPPGVGKTSLGRSIARAMGRKFIRISLGGVRDEAEIRGHRRTYIGALPGRIIQGLKQVGTNNPVFMMDEVDKIGSDFRGNPAAALLEVLDPEQNFSFSDHYLNIPFDLSSVLFITTANSIDPIPSALKDRMEVIELSGYTDDEKLKIALSYLLPRQLKENGLKAGQLKISRETILTIINEYTDEAGLRNLEKELAAICRKTARRIAEGEKGPFTIFKGNLHRFLGAPPYLPDELRRLDEVGVATGLAWTQSGGEILYVETIILKGKGNFTLTGQLGEVMKESAQAALSYARSRSERLHLRDNFYEHLDIHIHVPAGAIPKDGPSAGVTLVTSLISALTKIPVKKDIAMTGEITLRGKVLPIGGLKEKTLAAIRAKIKTLIIPEQNKRDLMEIPRAVRRRIEFVLVKDIDEVVELALLSPKTRGAKLLLKRHAPHRGVTPRIMKIG